MANEDPLRTKSHQPDPCATPGVPAVFKEPPTRVVRCAEPQVSLPEEFTAPERIPAAPDAPLPVLVPVIVRSDGITLLCSDVEGVGPFGDPSTVAGGAVSEEVHLPTLGLSLSQYRYLGSVPADVIQGFADPGADREAFRQATKLTAQQVAVLAVQVENARTRVNATARVLAQLDLRCQWGNFQLLLDCGAGAILTSDGVTDEARNPVIIPAGSVLSAASQEAAEQAARQQARQQIACRWGNAETTITCADLGFPDPVATDEEDTFGFGLRVGSVTIPANTVISAVSKADADEQARQQGLASLNCFYLNAEVNLSCVGVSPDIFAGTEVLNPETPALAHLGETGNPVRVPAGVRQSSVSQADVDAEASALALSALVCRWGNAEVIKRCPTQTFNGTTYPASDKSGRLEVIIPAGEVKSAVSQEDADALADLQAEFGLDCLYCNPEVPPRCVPPEVLDREDFVIPIPLAWVTSDWSVDATPGIAAGAICGRLIEEAVSVAEQVARVPFPSSAAKCSYVNDEIKVACISDPTKGIIGLFTAAAGAALAAASTPPPFDADEAKRYLVVSAGAQRVYASSFADLPASYNTPGRDLAEAAKAYANELARREGLASLNCFFGNDERTFTCAERLNLNPGQVAKLNPQAVDNVLISENSFQSFISKAEANALRDAQGLATLRCFFTNPPIRMLCYQGINTNPNSVPPPTAENALTGEITFGDGTADTRQGLPEGEVSSVARGHPTNPVIVPAGLYTSYVDPESALRDAVNAARASLDCFWTNKDLQIFCGAEPEQADKDVTTYSGAAEVYGTIDSTANGSSVRPVVVQAHLESSYLGAQDATRLGILRGMSVLDCFWKNDEKTINCPTPTSKTRFVAGVPKKSTVAAGLLASYVSKGEANNQAQILAESLLYCLYENEVYPPEDPDCEGMSVPRAGIAAGAIRLNDSATVKTMADLVFAAQGGCVDDLEGFQGMLDSSGAGTGEPGAPGEGPDCKGNCHGFYK